MALIEMLSLKGWMDLVKFGIQKNGNEQQCQPWITISKIINILTYASIQAINIVNWNHGK